MVLADIQDLAKRYQDIIIDAGGRDSVELRMSMVVANVMVVPVQAGQFDIWTLGRMSDLVEQAKSFNPNLRPYGAALSCGHQPCGEGHR